MVSSRTLAISGPPRELATDGRLPSPILGYLPRCLARRRLARPAASAVFGELVEGTLLFADISGFTALAKQLGRHGREGAEELTGLLNDYFEEMVGLVDQHGGDVLQFGGDSLLAVFGLDAEPSAEPEAAAVRCGLDMQAAMHRFERLETSAGRFRLSMGIAVHHGPFLLASAGAWAGQLQQVVIGPTLNRLTAAESHAGPGELLVTLETVGRIDASLVLGEPRHGCVPILALARAVSARTGSGGSRVDRAASRGPGGPQWWEPASRSGVEQRAAGRNVAPPDPWIRIDPAAEELLRPYLLPALYRRIVEDPAGCGAEGEHRHVATMFVHFADLSGIMQATVAGLPDMAGTRPVAAAGSRRDERDAAGTTHASGDPEWSVAEAVGFLDACLAAMTECAARHGGSLARVSADVLGDKLLVLFGAPLAVENPEQRAVRCALDMQQRLAELNESLPFPLTQRIGITAGSAFCGNVGSHLRREYTVISDEVNMAARLMAAAGPSEVLVSPDIARKASAFSFEHRPVRVKGQPQPLEAYWLVSAERPAAPPRPGRKLVGRDAECERFRRLLAEVLDGRGQLVTVSGEAGAGKTRLVEEFAADCRAAGMSCPRGECLPHGQSAPGHAWTAILRQIVGAGPDDAAGVVHARLVATLRAISPAHAVWSPVLAGVLGIPLELPQNDHTRALGPRQRKEKLLALCLELIEHHARTAPTCLVLEDVHWMDPLSRELLGDLAPRLQARPLLIVATHRPGFELPGLAADEPRPDHVPRLSQLELAPLSSRATIELLGQLLGTPAVPGRLRRLVFEKTQGNPLYVEELIRTLVGTGHLVPDTAGKQYQLTRDPADADLPGTIQGLVLSRIDRLSEEQRRIVQVASVCGRSFPRDLLRSVLPFPITPEALNDRLDELARLELIVPAAAPADAPTGTAPPGICAFRHTLIQEAVYESLSYARRREIHCAIAEELERTSGDRAEPCEMLARHFDLARVSDKAFHYLALAGDKARHAYANAQAVEHYRRALQHLPNLDAAPGTQDLSRLLEHLADVLSLEGEYAAAVQHYSEALRHADRPVHRARLEGKLGGVFYRQGQPQAGIEHLEAGLAHLGIRLPQTRWQMRVSLVRQALIQAAHTLFPRLFVRPRPADAEATRAAIEIYEALSRISFESDLDRTLDAHLRQLNLCETLPGSPEMAQTYSSHGIVCGTIPLFGRALRYQRKGLAIREARGDRWGVAQSSNFMGISCYWMGRWDEARECLERSARVFHDIGDRWETEVTWLILSFIALRRGELDDAARHARASLELSRRADDPQGMGWALGALAEARSRQGRLDEALAHARHARACSEQAGDRMYLAAVARILGQIHLRRGETGEAIEELERSVSQIREFGLRHEYVLGANAALAEALLVGQAFQPVPSDLKRIRHLCHAAVRRARHFPNWLGDSYRVAALAAWAAGRPAAAQRFFERSLAACESLGARYDLAATWHDCGRFLAAAGCPEARACLREAIRLFDACGATFDRERSEAFAAGLPARSAAGHSALTGPHRVRGRLRRSVLAIAGKTSSATQDRFP